MDWRLHCASNILKHLSCKPGRFMQWSGNLRVDPGNPQWEDDWPLWNCFFLDGLPDLSGHCHFTTMCVMPEAEHCRRSDVSAANGNWLSGQLLPYHVTSSHSYLRRSVWRSMCSHPSPSDTQALRKVLPLLQEDKCWKIVWFLPNRTHNFQQDSSKVLICSGQNNFAQAWLHLVLLSCHRMNQLVLRPGRLRR